MFASRSKKRMIASAVLAAGMAGLLITAPTTATAAAPHGMDRMVRADGFPAALAAVRDRHGRTHHYTAGTGDLRTGAKVPINGRVRIGSASKMFIAVVILQLAGEGRIGLDTPIETYLPGLLHGEGFNPDQITVRHLLQHTSGLPDYTDSMFQELGDYLPVRHTYFEPHELVAKTLTMRPQPVGVSWSYSNTNYVLAGLIAQRVSGRPLAELITTRVINRVGLRDTYVPQAGEEGLRGRHPHGYLRDLTADQLRDYTEMDPSWGWSAGQMVSTPGDLNTFLRALLDGRLLEQAQLAQMLTTVEAGDDMRYGLGLMRIPLSCGGAYWGHGGDIPGYSVRDGATDDGRAVTLAVTAMASSVKDESAVVAREEFVDTALCTK